MSRVDQLRFAVVAWEAFKTDLESRISHRESLPGPRNSFLKDALALRNQWVSIGETIASLKRELDTPDKTATSSSRR